MQVKTNTKCKYKDVISTLRKEKQIQNASTKTSFKCWTTTCAYSRRRPKEFIKVRARARARARARVRARVKG